MSEKTPLQLDQEKLTGQVHKAIKKALKKERRALKELFYATAGSESIFEPIVNSYSETSSPENKEVRKIKWEEVKQALDANIEESAKSLVSTLNKHDLFKVRSLKITFKGKHKNGNKKG